MSTFPNCECFLFSLLSLSLPLIKFNLLDFFQLPLEWDAGVNRGTLQQREKLFPRKSSKSGCTGRHQREKKKRKSSRANWGNCKLKKLPAHPLLQQYDIDTGAKRTRLWNQLHDRTHIQGITSMTDWLNSDD